MVLKNKKKVYLSFPKNLLDFMEEEISKKNITRTKYINQLVKKELEKFQKRKIEKILEGKS